MTGRGWFGQIDLGRGRGFGGDDVLDVGLERVLVFERVHLDAVRRSAAEALVSVAQPSYIPV